jgi:hypothetical protein
MQVLSLKLSNNTYDTDNWSDDLAFTRHGRTVTTSAHNGGRSLEALYGMPRVYDARSIGYVPWLSYLRQSTQTKLGARQNLDCRKWVGNRSPVTV